MIGPYVKLFFDEFIKDRFGTKPDVLNFLMQHERRDACFKGICEQVVKAELSNIGKRMDIRRVKLLTEAGARMFCDAALKHAEEKILTQAEKQRRIDDASRLENLQAELVDCNIIIATDNDKPEKLKCH